MGSYYFYLDVFLIYLCLTNQASKQRSLNLIFVHVTGIPRIEVRHEILYTCI